jgi:hypothetical protein
MINGYGMVVSPFDRLRSGRSRIDEKLIGSTASLLSPATDCSCLPVTTVIDSKTGYYQASSQENERGKIRSSGTGEVERAYSNSGRELAVDIVL